MKKLLLNLSLLLIISYAKAQCVKGNCENGFGIFNFSNGNIYEGYFKNGLFNGIGQYFIGEDMIYKGEFLNDKMNGYGILSFSDGTRYFGKFNDKVLEGYVLFEDKNGVNAFIFSGGKATSEVSKIKNINNPKNCNGNCIDGFGEIKNSNDSKIQAIFKDGQAVLGNIQNKSTKYSGQILNNKPHGFGILVDGKETYIGYFNNGKKNGDSIIASQVYATKSHHWVEGDNSDTVTNKLNQKKFDKELKKLLDLTYEEIKANSVYDEFFAIYSLNQKFMDTFSVTFTEGSGSLLDIIIIDFDKNGLSKNDVSIALKECDFITKFRPENYFYKNKFISIKDGQSLNLIIDSKSDKVQGCIAGNCKNGFGKISIYNHIYEGNFKDGKKDGDGTMKYANGDFYSGKWQNDKKHGIGKFIWKNGNSHDGEWKDDKLHGQGTYYFSDGYKYIGEFKDGNFNGFGIQYDSEGLKLYEGTFKDGTPHGKGKVYDKKGAVIKQGEFVNGKLKK